MRQEGQIMLGHYQKVPKALGAVAFEDSIVVRADSDIVGLFGFVNWIHDDFYLEVKL